METKGRTGYRPWDLNIYTMAVSLLGDLQGGTQQRGDADHRIRTPSYQVSKFWMVVLFCFVFGLIYSRLIAGVLGNPRIPMDTDQKINIKNTKKRRVSLHKRIKKRGWDNNNSNCSALL